MPSSILIVEDEPIVGLELQEYLGFAGYHVPAIVQDGEAVLAAVIKHNPEAILMDIRLTSAFSGIDAANQLRLEHNIPIIYLTAYSDEDTLKEAATTMPDGYLVKPIDEASLIATLRIALENARRRRVEALDLSRYVPVIDTIADPVCLFDDNGRLFHLNHNAQMLLGIPDTQGCAGFDVHNLVAEIQYENGQMVLGSYTIKPHLVGNQDVELRLEPLASRAGTHSGLIGYLELQAAS